MNDVPRAIQLEGRLPLRGAEILVSRHAERNSCHAEPGEASPFGDETLRCAQGDTLRCSENVRFHPSWVRRNRVKTQIPQHWFTRPSRSNGAPLAVCPNRQSAIANQARGCQPASAQRVPLTAEFFSMNTMAPAISS